MRPLIAIAGRRTTSSDVLLLAGVSAAETVCDAVLRAGGEPVIVHGGDRAAIAEIPGRLARFDGVCLPGGGDINPSRYSQAADARSEAPDDRQDEFDLAMNRTVLGGTGAGRPVPALAIGRGLQVLNVACGGTLRQHLPAGLVEHLSARHEVTIARGSRLRPAGGGGHHHRLVRASPGDRPARRRTARHRLRGRRVRRGGRAPRGRHPGRAVAAGGPRRRPLA
jgi:putative glutamine amidotransferase